MRDSGRKRRQIARYPAILLILLVSIYNPSGKPALDVAVNGFFIVVMAQK